MFERRKTEKSKADKRNLSRKSFSYYMPVVDDNSEKPIGYLTDISPRGFRLDCRQELPVNHTYSLRLDLNDDVADKSSMVVVARNQWCRHDQLDPFVYNIGFQIVSIAPDDAVIFQRMIERYGVSA